MNERQAMELARDALLRVAEVPVLIPGIGLAIAALVTALDQQPQSEPPVTKRESMAAALLVASMDSAGVGVTWKVALTRLRAEQGSPGLSQFWRMADAALEHMPYLDKLQAKADARERAAQSATSRSAQAKMMQTPNDWRNT